MSRVFGYCHLFDTDRFTVSCVIGSWSRTELTVKRIDGSCFALLLPDEKPAFTFNRTLVYLIGGFEI